MQYAHLNDGDSASLGAIPLADSRERTGPISRSDYYCRACRTKSTKHQEVTHTAMECINERTDLLETEIVRLKDRDIKSRLMIKELETKLAGIEDAMKGMTAPKQPQAAPYAFGLGHKLRHQLKKSQSEDVPHGDQADVNYDHILTPKRTESKERLGLFGSLGAASQHR